MTSTYSYYTTLRQNIGGFTIQIHRVTDNYKLGGLLMQFNDREVFENLPTNLNNYFSWSGIEIKKYIKKKGIRGHVLCTWRIYSEKRATLAIDCNSDKNLDAPVYE